MANMTLEKNTRTQSQKLFVNRIDPIFWLLNKIVFAPLFKPKDASTQRGYAILENAEVDFLVENLNKHRVILWINILLALYLAGWGLESIKAAGDPAIVVTGLLAPAMITGAAWYTVSFGGIPEKFLSLAVTLTFCMFLAFSMSMTLLVSLLVSITPWEVGAFILVPMYGSMYIASMWYDNIDGLKIGLDSTLLKFSRASLNYYQKHGWISTAETQGELYSTSTSRTDGQIARFTHYVGMLERALTMLESRRTTSVANRLIAESTGHLLSIVSLQHHVDNISESDFRAYLSEAQDMDQDAVDEKTIAYLLTIIEHLSSIFNEDAADDISAARNQITDFENQRKTAQMKPNPVDQDHSTKTGLVEQELADYLFTQIFYQLLSVIRVHRQVFFQRLASRGE